MYIYVADEVIFVFLMGDIIILPCLNFMFTMSS
jgi:hypothetical protein